MEQIASGKTVIVNIILEYEKKLLFLPVLSKCEGTLPLTCYFMATLLSVFVAFNSP